MDLATYVPTRAEIAKVFKRSERWIGELRARGALPEEGATLAEFVAAWSLYLVEKEGKSSALDTERTRVARAQAEAQEMRNALARGDLIEAHAVTSAWQVILGRVRARFLAIPSRAAPRVIAAGTAVAAEQILTELIHEGLAELADGDAAGYPDAGTDAEEGGPGGLVGNAAAAEADRERVG